MADSITSQNAMSPEAPTPGHEPDFDGEVQDSAPGMRSGELLPSQTAHSPSLVTRPTVSFAEEENPPPKPPRPISPMLEAEGTLIEAFPSIDVKVVKAVLVASGGQVEPAFNALLSMSDPDFQEEQPPPQPPRPTPAQKQLEDDERYARQLAERYNSRSPEYVHEQRATPASTGERERRQTPNQSYNEEQERSFFDDDLPVIRDNIRKGFTETQTKVNRWITDFRKRIDGEDENEVIQQPSRPDQRQDYGPSQSQQLYGIRKHAEMNRRSQERDRYDADPHVLSDDLANLELRDEEIPPPQPRRPSRPLANPDLLKTSAMPAQRGPVDEVEAANTQSTGKSTKWQPLTSVAPNPEAEDNDPFSLGDSDEEREAKTKDVNPSDSERLKRASQAKPEEATEASRKVLGEHERSGSLGTKDKTMEELLKNS